MSVFSKLARVVVAAALALALCVTGAAVAQAPNNPVGLWNFQAYNDNSPNLAALGNQDICFLANGTWFGTTFPNWNGRWFQKGNNAAGNGDRVRLLGNWANGDGNDSAEIDFANLNTLAGPWNEWTDGFADVLWLRVIGTRIGNVCPAPALPEFDALTEAQRRPWSEKGATAPACRLE